MKKAKIFIRRFAQAFFVFLFFYLLRRSTDFPLPEKLPLSFFFRIDGLLAVFTTVSTGHFVGYFIPAAIIVVCVTIWGNFFCYWICPFGGLIDLGNIVTARRKWGLSICVPAFLRKIRLFLLAGFLLTAVTSFFIAVPNLFWASDPYVIITRAFILKGGWIILFATVFAASIVIPRMWCNYMCPLGCLYYHLGRARKAEFFVQRKK